MNEEEKKEFEEFLKWKKEKSNMTESEPSKNESVAVNNESKQEMPQKSSKLGKGLGCGCLSIIAFILLLAIFSNGSHNQDNSSTVDWSEASVMSEYFIKSFMKFPDDVEFIKDSKNVNEEGNYVFKVTGRIKANNTFGQAVPYTYNIRIKYNGGEWSSKSNWSLLGGNLYNEATREFTELN